MKNAGITSQSTWTNSDFSLFRKGTSDYFLLLTALALAAFGLVMVYSSSYIFAQERFNDGLYYFRRHIIYLIIGIAAMFFFRFIDYRVWRKCALPIFFLSMVSMALVLVPGIGHRAGGATRWISLGGYSFQPIEFAKIALILYMAERFSRRDLNFTCIKSGFLFHLWPPVLLAGLALLQPDFGSAALLAMCTLLIFYVVGVRLRYLVSLFLVTVPIFYYAIVMVPYRKARLLTFLDPWADPQNSGFQIIQSFLAFFRGGLFGAGLGNSKEKLFYLPEAHNDFILSVVGEELGFIGICLVCIGFLFLFFRSVRVSAKAEDSFGAIVAAGLAVLIGLEVFLNAGIVLGILPTKGMNLPFISSGGSSIICALLSIGILLSISARENKSNIRQILS